MSVNKDLEVGITMSGADKGAGLTQRRTRGSDSPSQASDVQVGREYLAEAVAPHETYEGLHRYDPLATWSEEEERKVVRKTDIYLLSWLCVMVLIYAVNFELC